MIGWNE
jgi:hypothetical protein